MKYLLDTNVVSELVAKAPNAEVVKWLDALDPECVYLSVITIGEISKGVEKLPECLRKDKLRSWLNNELLQQFAGRMLVLDTATMVFWGELSARLERQGVSLPAIDSLIAAQTLMNQCTFVTRNTIHFLAAGVTLINPWDAPQLDRPYRLNDRPN